jgi:hypothetical protein
MGSPAITDHVETGQDMPVFADEKTCSSQIPAHLDPQSAGLKRWLLPDVPANNHDPSHCKT